MYYDCLGNNEYRLTLKVYRDCGTSTVGLDNPASFGVYSGGTLVQTFEIFSPQLTIIPVVINNPCLVAPPNVCVEEGIYRTIITLGPSTQGYDIIYQRCCRNHTIRNLTNPGVQGATYATHIPADALALCNSSPRFNNFPPLAICAGDPLNFDHSATDPDGDSLVYRLCATYQGGSQNNPAPAPPGPPPFPIVNYAPGYTGNNPMDASPTLAINPSTGLLTGTPNQLGQFVVGVCVDEYRNGVRINVHQRDFQFNVANCNRTVVAVIANAPDSVISQCGDFTVQFGNQSIGASTYLWDFGIAGITSDTSDQRNPVYTFPDTGTYVVKLIANPRTPCTDSTYVYVKVYPELKANFDMADACPGVPVQFTDSSKSSYGTITSYLWTFGNGRVSQDQHPIMTYTAGGTYQVNLRVTNTYGCEAIATKSIIIFPPPVASFDIDGICIFDEINFINTSTVTGGSIVSYEWTLLGHGVISTSHDAKHVFTSSAQYSVQLIIHTDMGCSDTVERTIDISPKPLAEAFGDTIVCPGEAVLLSATGGDNYQWGPFEAPIASPYQATTIVYPVEDTRFVVTVADDCYYDTASVLVRVFPVPDLAARPDTAIYRGDSALLSASSNSAISYLWSPIDGAMANQRTLWASPEETTTYTILVTDHNGCVSMKTVTIYVMPVCDNLFIPNAFSPNTDGINDHFMPIDFGHNDMHAFRVFNRWGQLLFETSEVGRGWDGTFNSKPQPLDTYVYQLILECNGNTVTRHGHFLLLR